MENIYIRFANVNDKENIIEFIKSHWSENHIFVKSPGIFEYQHMSNGNELSYVIAEDKDNKICGVCGYIEYNKNKTDICQALWKVIETGDTMLGVKLLNFLKYELKPKLLCCNGINNKIIPLHKFLGNQVGKLKQYYRIGNKENYKIAVINKKSILPVNHNKYSLKNIESFEELNEIFNFDSHINRKPYKDKWYINHRYFKHPVYKYNVYGINIGQERINSILVGREIIQNCSKIFRIVDFIGNDEEIAEISSSIQSLIDRNEYEYIDFYCYGIDHNIMTKAGFSLRDENDTNIIPNYFEPFEQKNVDINFFADNIDEFYMFKADGDQDRPSIIL